MSVVVEDSTPNGVPVRLGADRWWVVVTLPVGGVSYSYQRPRFVEFREARIAVRDYTWTTRGFAVAFLLMAVFARRFTQ